MARAGGHSSVADYFRCLIREDMNRCLNADVPRGQYLIEITTAYGQLSPQVVAASDLGDALSSAMEIPEEQWFDEGGMAKGA